MTIQENGPDPIDVHVGQRIRLRRVQMNLSQGTVARRMGVSFQQVQKFENAQNRVSAARLFKLARILEVPVEFFYQGLPAEAAPGLPDALPQGAGVATDLMAQPIAAELLTTFFQIEHGFIRRALIDFMKRLGKGDGSLADFISQATPRGRGRPKKEG